MTVSFHSAGIFVSHRCFVSHRYCYYRNHSWITQWQIPPYKSCYNLYRSDRDGSSGKRGGRGACAYMRKEYGISSIDEWKLCCPDVEYQWLTLKLKDTRTTYIGNLYRAPSGSIPNDLELIENKLLHIPQWGTPDILLCGDLNIDILKPNCAGSKALKAFLNRTCINQSITEATRVTEHTDHLISNRPEIYNTNGVLDVGTSDLSLIYGIRKRA